MRVLYLSYDGMTDPLGQSQVLPYLAGLTRRGHEITLVSCEKPEHTAGKERARERCRDAAIDWHPLRYRKRPPILSTVIDLRAMRRAAADLQRCKGFDLVHCRSYLPAIIGESMKREHGLPFLFDMRGFWADERVERGFWPSRNPLFRTAYRRFKHWEKQFFHDADVVVSLTDMARREIESWPEGRRPTAPVQVIPCCVDLDLFNPGGGKARAAGRNRLGLDARTPVLLYVGSLGLTYMIEAMFRLFKAFQAARPGAKFLFISHHSRDEIEAMARTHDVDAGEIITIVAPRDEMPALIAAGDVGVSFILPTYAAMASSPTKVAEMLAMGVPVIANSGVGDTAKIVRQSGAGAVVESFDEQSLAAAVAAVDRASLTATKVREAAIRWFDLEDGVARYDAIYRSIAARVP